jgi:hypothetical protein
MADWVPSTSQRNGGARFRCMRRSPLCLTVMGPSRLRMYQIHGAVEQLLGQAVPRSTVKMALAASGRFERVSRGVYGLTSDAALE